MTLNRNELIALVDQAELAVQDRRVRDELIEAMVASRKVNLAAAHEGYSRDRLKELCEALALDSSGRGKAQRRMRGAALEALRR